MTHDKWRSVREFSTTDENGNPTQLVIGLVELPGDRLEPAIQVDGRTALIPLEDIGSAVPEAVRGALTEWWKRQGRG
ncbi:hypothetical protein EIY87_00265 [Amycolatopsis eburnea]|uniref:Uncharacterized protein n=2 Tax=Amycolatopsis eburnea TaxID=2267691 RepID=A0A427TPU2_9PSEU|nr:hypothetical protein EIY87_00265 [Amycolatopsis eburnea]